MGLITIVTGAFVNQLTSLGGLTLYISEIFTPQQSVKTRGPIRAPFSHRRSSEAAPPQPASADRRAETTLFLRKNVKHCGIFQVDKSIQWSPKILEVLLGTIPPNPPLMGRVRADIRRTFIEFSGGRGCLQPSSLRFSIFSPWKRLETAWHGRSSLKNGQAVQLLCSSCFQPGRKKTKRWNGQKSCTLEL